MDDAYKKEIMSRTKTFNYFLWDILKTKEFGIIIRIPQRHDLMFSTNLPGNIFEIGNAENTRIIRSEVGEVDVVIHKNEKRFRSSLHLVEDQWWFIYYSS